MKEIVYSCQKFHNYNFGKEVTVYSDHKPLETLFNKPLLSAPMRIQKMRIKLQWYDITVKYRKGTTMYIPYTLTLYTGHIWVKSSQRTVPEKSILASHEYRHEKSRT